MSIFTYNGSAILAMAGKNCVAIGSDLRFGVELQTLATDYQKVHKINDRLFLGLGGLATDASTVLATCKFRHNMYQLGEEQPMEPSTFAHMFSNMLYEKRFGPYYTMPLIAGLEEKSTPYIAGMDCIGCLQTADDFLVQGSNTDSLFGAAEAFWKPDMEPEELFQSTAQALLSAADRDCMAGWGAVVYLITPDKVIARTLKGRMD